MFLLGCCCLFSLYLYLNSFARVMQVVFKSISALPHPFHRIFTPPISSTGTQPALLFSFDRLVEEQHEI